MARAAVDSSGGEGGDGDLIAREYMDTPLVTAIEIDVTSRSEKTFSMASTIALGLSCTHREEDEKAYGMQLSRSHVTKPHVACICTRAHTHMHAPMLTHAHAHVLLAPSVQVCMHACVCACVCAHTRTRTCTLHTCIHSHTRTLEHSMLVIHMGLLALGFCLNFSVQIWWTV